MSADASSSSKAKREVVVTQTLDGSVLSCTENVDSLPALLEDGAIDVLEVILVPTLTGNDQPKLTLSSSCRYSLQEIVRKGDHLSLRYSQRRD